MLGAHVYIEAADFADLRTRRHAEVFDQFVEHLACLDAVCVHRIADFHLEGVTLGGNFFGNVRLHVFDSLFVLRDFR